MPLLSIIADDLTGACDTGAGFAHAGLRTLVVLDTLRGGGVASVDADVVVYNTESRYLPVAQATNAVVCAARAARDITDRLASGGRRFSGENHTDTTSISTDAETRLKPRPPDSGTRPPDSGTRPTDSDTRPTVNDAWVYKKIDSTLRGHPGEELAALMAACQVDCALVAPAFPAQGRTTIDAQVWVNGQPLAQTPFAAERANGDLRVVFGGLGIPVHVLGLNDATGTFSVRQGVTMLAHRLRGLHGIALADAVTDDDLMTVALAAQHAGIRMLCGSAGLAHALLALMGDLDCKRATVGLQGPVLVVAGSRNPVTLRQIDMARRRGVKVINVPAEFGQDDIASGVHAKGTFSVADVAIALTKEISAGRPVIVTTIGLPDSPLGKDMIARRLGAVVAQVVAHIIPGALVLTGGDVATAVCTALGAHVLELRGELQPGIALGRLADGPYAGLPVVTKAGGFGRADALIEILATVPSG